MLTIDRLRCEFRTNPLGLSTLQPRFSWQLVSDRQDTMQQSYQLRLATDPQFESTLWDSGEISTTQSHLVEYSGAPLQWATPYFWQVKVSDTHGHTSQWSETATFEPSMNPEDWQAVYITGETPEDEESYHGTLYRKELAVEKEVAHARIYASAKGVYNLYCNGTRVGDDYLNPGWTEYYDRFLYVTHDVTHLLQQGDNAVGFMVGPGWYKSGLQTGREDWYHYGKTTALIAQLVITYADGTTATIGTDSSWKAGESPVRYSQIYHGEVYDARLEQAGWSTPSFEDSQWKTVTVESEDTSRLVPHDGVPVLAQEEFSAKEFFTTPDGDRVIDFGQNLTGWVRFTVTGNAGDRVVFRHAEILDVDGNFYTKNLRRAKQRIEYTLKGGEEEVYFPYHCFQGFRYIAIDEYPGEINPAAFTSVAVYSQMEQIGTFVSSHGLLNQLMSNIQWGMKGNFLDIPTDCPQRDERLGWTGDAQVFVRAASYLMDTAPFFTKWLRDVEKAQFDNGEIPNIVPNILQPKWIDHPQVGVTGWADAVAIVPWTMYRYFGDTRILEELYPSMRDWVDFVHRQSEDGVLWKSGHQLGDWLALDAKEGSYQGSTPTDLIATAYFAYSTWIVAESAKVLGYTEDVSSYSLLYTFIKAAFQDEYFDRSGALKGDTQTAHVLALFLDLAPEEYKEQTVQRLRELIEEYGSLTTGFLGTPYLCHALSQQGLVEQAYMLLLKEDYPSWIYSVKQGATTVWEHWDGMKPDGTMWSDDMNSFNHYAYGAVADWIFSTIGGIDTAKDTPAFAGLVIAPQPSRQLEWAETHYDSPYGAIDTRWEWQGDQLHLEYTVPANTTAQVVLSGVTKPLEGYTVADGVATATVGSGRYTVTYPYQQA